VCPVCCYDQVTPNEIIEFELLKRKERYAQPDDLTFGFPGEKAALILSIIISIIIAIVLGIVSFGIIIVILLISLIYLKISHLSSQKNMIRCSEANFRTIFRMAKVGAYRLNIPLPEVYITNNPQYNAYTMGFYKYGFIVINSSIARDFKPNELLFVVGHEMGHMKKYHTTWLNLLNPAKTEGTKFIFAPLMQVIFNVWNVKAEHTADQAGLIACKDLKSAVLSLLKLAGGLDVEKEVDITKLIDQKREQNEILVSLVEYLGTHPFIENRIKQLLSFNSARRFQFQ
jgi:Zn-dependent protease with chaperone function